MAETGVWRALAEAGIPTVMLTGRGSLHAAMLGSGLATQLPLRRMQHRCADDEEARLALARWFVDLKLQSYDLSLMYLTQRYGTTSSDGDEFVTQRNRGREKLLGADSIDVLMGLEGSIARAWFALLARHLPYKWKFAGRNRRPPRDSVNALLSLAYTLLHSEIRNVLMASGFDPSLGFLHQDYPGREALVLDFTEIFRSGVDAFVLQLLNEKDLNEDSFYYREAEGCRLSKTSRPLFFKAWADFRDHWPRPLAEQEEGEVWPTALLREQVGGQLAMIREYMGTLEVPHG